MLDYRQEQVRTFIDSVERINNLLGPIPNAEGDLVYGDEYITQVLDDLTEFVVNLSQARNTIYQYLINQVEQQKGDIYLTMLTEFADATKWVKDLEIEAFGKPTFNEPLIKDVLTNAYNNQKQQEQAITAFIDTIKNIQTMEELAKLNKSYELNADKLRFSRESELKEDSWESDKYRHDRYIHEEYMDLLEDLWRLADTGFEDYHLGMFQRIFRSTKTEDMDFIPSWLEESNMDKPYKELISTLYDLNEGEVSHKLSNKLSLKDRKEIFTFLDHSLIVDPLELSNDKETIEFILIKLLCSFPLHQKEVLVLKDFLGTNDLKELKEYIVEYFVKVYESKSLLYTVKILQEVFTNS